MFSLLSASSLCRTVGHKDHLSSPIFRLECLSASFGCQRGSVPESSPRLAAVDNVDNLADMLFSVCGCHVPKDSDSFPQLFAAVSISTP